MKPLRMERASRLLQAVHDNDVAGIVKGDSSAERARRSDGAGNAFRREYFATRAPEALDEAIEAYRAACAAADDANASVDDYTRSVYANSLGGMLAERYGATQRLDDLQEAAAAFERADALTPDDSPYRKMVASNLALCTQQLFNRTGEPRWVERCVVHCHRAWELSDRGSDERFSYAGTLGPACAVAYPLLGEPRHLDWGIEAFEEILPEVREPVKVLGRLAGLRTMRFNAFQRPEDLDGAIADLRRALEGPIDDDLGRTWRENLAELVLYRYTGSADPEDLALADACLGGGAPGDGLAPRTTVALATSWMSRSRRTGLDADRDRAIAAHEAALAVKQEPDAERVTLLAGLGALLGERCLETHSEADRRREGELVDEVLELGSFDSDDAAQAVERLGVTLQNQYTAGGRMHDLERAITCMGALAEVLEPTSSSYGSTLTSLGNALGDRFARTHVEEDWERGLACHERAVPVLAGESRAVALTNLGTHLGRGRAGRGASPLLDRSIEAYEAAVALTEPGADTLPARLDNLGAALSERFGANRDPDDLRRAVELHEQALAMLPDLSQVRVGVLNNLGNRLVTRFEQGGEVADLERSFRTFAEAATGTLSVAAEDALLAARNWLNAAFSHERWSQAAQAYERFDAIAVGLLGVQQGRRDKETWLREFADVPARAAYALARLGRLESAVMSLEHGSARLLAEALQRGTRADPAEVGLPGGAVRRATFEQVRRAAMDTPLAYLCSTAHGGLALVVVGDGAVEPVWLGAFDRAALDRALVGDQEAPGYLAAYLDWKDHPGQAEVFERWRMALRRMGTWQGQRVMTPLLPALGGSDRVVLVCVGLLSLLPWHASRVPGAHVVDGLSVRYVPNVHALARAPAAEDPVFSAVEDPRPAAGEPLRYAALEVQACAARFAARRIVAGGDATGAAVLMSLEGGGVFHFAGHAGSDLERPLQSGLEVAGPARLTLEELLPHPTGGRLAVLSACETGLPGLDLPEETVSLATGFLQMGFAGVVASLWPVVDVSTWLLMERFYTLWRVERMEPAEALSRAQCWLRDALPGALRRCLPDPEADDHVLAGLHARLAALPDDEPPFRDAYFWAPFSYWGV